MEENKSHEHEIEELVKWAEELVKSDSSAEQCVVVRTQKENQYYLFNHHMISGSVEEEDVFLKMLAENEDTEIRCVVCMWSDYTIDMMSHHLLKSLIELNPANKNTAVILRTVGGLQTKPLRSCMPPIDMFYDGKTMKIHKSNVNIINDVKKNARCCMPGILFIS